MELGADYTPGMSQYKEGRVVQVSSLPSLGNLGHARLAMPGYLATIPLHHAKPGRHGIMSKLPCCPQVSGQQVTLELQAGASTRVGGRFSMVEEEVEVERVVTLTLGELIQPLLVA